MFKRDQAFSRKKKQLLLCWQLFFFQPGSWALWTATTTVHHCRDGPGQVMAVPGLHQAWRWELQLKLQSLFLQIKESSPSVLLVSFYKLQMSFQRSKERQSVLTAHWTCTVTFDLLEHRPICSRGSELNQRDRWVPCHFPKSFSSGAQFGKTAGSEKSSGSSRLLPFQIRDQIRCKNLLAPLWMKMAAISWQYLCPC